MDAHSRQTQWNDGCASRAWTYRAMQSPIFTHALTREHFHFMPFSTAMARAFARESARRIALRRKLDARLTPPPWH